MVKKLIDIALAEVGYLEKKNKTSLDSKTANAGSKNYTKYARDMMKYHAGIYVNGYAWCDTFVDWCFMKAFGSDKAKELIHGWSAYTPTSASYYKQKGEWHTSPKVGDQIFFKGTNGVICHTGIVYKVDSTYVYTVEGNTSSASGVVANGGAVEKKKYKLNYSRIAGYGRPKYPKAEYNTVGEIVDELNRRGIITDTNLWMNKLKEDINCYHFAKKCAEQTENCIGKKELTTVNDIVWELNFMGIMDSKELWLDKLSKDTSAYWLARKIAHMTKRK